jgi:hypothetical protein
MTRLARSRAHGPAAAALAVLAIACRSPDRDADLTPPPGYVDPPVKALEKQPTRASSPRIGRGFYEREVGLDGASWRWMGKSGEITLPWPGGTTATLRLHGRVPLELVGAPPTITVALGGHVLESGAAASDAFDREWRVGRDVFGAGASSLLVITTSATGKAGGDVRSLGFALDSLEWDRLAAGAPPAPSPVPSK